MKIGTGERIVVAVTTNCDYVITYVYTCLEMYAVNLGSVVRSQRARPKGKANIFGIREKLRNTTEVYSRA